MTASPDGSSGLRRYKNPKRNVANFRRLWLTRAAMATDAFTLLATSVGLAACRVWNLPEREPTVACERSIDGEILPVRLRSGILPTAARPE